MKSILKHKLNKLLLNIQIILILSTMTASAESGITQKWVNRFNGAGNGTDEVADITIDQTGNVYITGKTKASNGYYDISTIKYNAIGVVQWIQTYNGSSSMNDEVCAITIDHNGNIYIVGKTQIGGSNNNYITIKYSNSGIEQWAAQYNGTGNNTDIAKAVVVDNIGNVYVTGSSWGTNTFLDFATVKYDSNGNQLWVARYSNLIGGANDEAESIAIDQNGYIYVTGTSIGNGSWEDIATVKYSPSGVQQWANRFNGSANDRDWGKKVSIDFSGNVIVGGTSNSINTQYDYQIIKYNASGTLLWEQKYNGPGNQSEFLSSMEMDNQGNIYVTGSSWGYGSDDYATIKYNSLGIVQWISRFNSPTNSYDAATAIAIDVIGNVYVTGESYGEYATIKYDLNGVQEWIGSYIGPGWDNKAKAIAVDVQGNIFIAGTSMNNGPIYHHDYAIVKYGPLITSGNTNVEMETSIITQSLFSNYLTICNNGILDNVISIYDIHGNLIFKRSISEPSIDIDMSNFSAGMYIVITEDKQGKRNKQKVVKI